MIDINVLDYLGRKESIFTQDIQRWGPEIEKGIKKHNFLVIGGAGSIGQAVVKELFKRRPGKLHVVDLSENNLVELVRDIRSSYGYIEGDFRTFAVDFGSVEFDAFVKNQGPYDYVLNLSALKHVRSEKDPYTLMRMIRVNVLNPLRIIDSDWMEEVKKYFCVSTDKAANPVNMMGASKRIMELFLLDRSKSVNISMARFANVAFSDGSLLYGFINRLKKRQPIAAPDDVRRYFICPEESGELCMLSALLGDNQDIFFPKMEEKLELIKFSDLAVKFLEMNGFTPLICSSEEEARAKVSEIHRGRWPCYFFSSDTTGEKDFEEFYTNSEEINLSRFNTIGIVKNTWLYDRQKLNSFLNSVEDMYRKGDWSRKELVELFGTVLNNFLHIEKNKFLDEKM